MVLFAESFAIRLHYAAGGEVQQCSATRPLHGAGCGRRSGRVFSSGLGSRLAHNGCRTEMRFEALVIDIALGEESWVMNLR